MKFGWKIALVVMLILLGIVLITIGMVLGGKFFNGYYLAYSINNKEGTCTITKCVSFAAKEITVPEAIGNYRVTEIGAYAFANQKKLTGISLPEGITGIGMAAFYECKSLAQISLPKSVTSIESFAFFGCDGLTSVSISEAVTTIGAGVFEKCNNLKTAVIPTSAIHTLPADSITSVVITSGKSIGNSAFRNFKNLTSITIFPSVETIGLGVFQGCKNIATATVPTCAISQLPKENLTHVTVNGGSHIDAKAFLYAPNLMSVTISETIQSIGSMAFSGCYKLVEVYNFSSLSITKGSIDNGHIGRYALNIYSTAEEASKAWTDENGCLFFEDGDVCYLLGYMGEDAELILPKDCNGKPYIIHQYAFYNHKNLTSITFPESVLEIEGYAFYGCSTLTDITLPDRLLQIGEYAFADCQKLTEVSFGKSITTIGAFVFEDCNKLNRILFRGTVQMWKAVKQGYNWSYYTPAYEIVCTDGTIPLN